MINKKVLNVLLKNSAAENKNIIIKELFAHIDNDYDYNDNKKNHVIDMLLDLTAVVTKDNIDVDYITNNISKFIYNGDSYDIRNVEIRNIDNIDCIILVGYEYKDKSKEHEDDIEYTIGSIDISFADNPEVLKKS